MNRFTEALDNYLEAKRDLDEAKENYQGYDFGYFFADKVFKKQEAEDALNAFFSRTTKGE